MSGGAPSDAEPHGAGRLSVSGPMVALHAADRLPAAQLPAVPGEAALTVAVMRSVPTERLAVRVCPDLPEIP